MACPSFTTCPALLVTSTQKPEMLEVADLHRPFEKWLKEQGIEYIRARSDQRSTIERGWPDFTLLHHRLPSLLIEFKTEKGPLSSHQKKVHARLLGKQFKPLVCRSVESAVESVQQWLSVAPPDQQPGLVRFGNGVWRKAGGRHEFVRPLQPDDMGLPLMIGT